MRSLEIGSDCIFDGIMEVTFVLTCDNGVVIMLKRKKLIFYRYKLKYLQMK